MMAGADFIKTSTGKEPVNAVLPVGLVMARMIREYYERTGHTIGLKPAGGIRAAKQALEWMLLMKEELDTRWLSPTLFRLGRERVARGHRAAARALRDGPVLGASPPSHGLGTARCRRSRKSSRRSSTVPRPRARARRTRGWTRTGGASDISSTAAGGSRPRANTRDGRSGARATRSRASRRDRTRTWTPRSAPRGARSAAGASSRGTPARGTLYALARGIQKHARVFAVLESLDNGKPIRESRDIDIPLVRATSTTTPGGRSSGDVELPGYEPVGVIGRSSRGTSRC
jgi:hypothetical protein